MLLTHTVSLFSKDAKWGDFRCLDRAQLPVTVLFRQKFGKCGKLVNVTISRKKDMKNPGKWSLLLISTWPLTEPILSCQIFVTNAIFLAGKLLSMGYGFVEFKKRKAAQKALKTLQHSMLDGHQLELKMSNKTTTTRSALSFKRHSIVLLMILWVESLCTKTYSSLPDKTKARNVRNKTQVRNKQERKYWWGMFHSKPRTRKSKSCLGKTERSFCWCQTTSL